MVNRCYNCAATVGGDFQIFAFFAVDSPIDNLSWTHISRAVAPKIDWHSLRYVQQFLDWT